jgi:hypothetical protein
MFDSNPTPALFDDDDDSFAQSDEGGLPEPAEGPEPEEA